MSYHWPLAFSSADRWVNCPGSIKLSEGLPPEPDTDATLEGNAADWVAKQYAAGNEVAYGTETPYPGFPVDYDMIHGAKLWAATIGYGSVSGVPVVSTLIHPTSAGGEPDGWTWNGIARVLDLPDYKYGFGVIEPYENWQTLGYVAGVLESLDLLTDPDVTVRQRIVQPRAYHQDGPVREWTATVGELRAYFNQMHLAAIQAIPVPGEGGDMIQGAYRTQTGAHCLHCPARLHCQTLQAAVTTATVFMGQAQRTAMDPAALGVTLSIVRDLAVLVEAYDTGLSAQAEGFLRQGQRVPGWKMDPVLSKLAWHKDVTVEEIDGLGVVIERSMRKPPTVHAVSVTPTQAINAGVSAELVGHYAARGPGGMKMVRDKGDDARRAFG